MVLLLMSGAVAHSESAREMVGQAIHSCAAYVFSLLSIMGLTSFLAITPANQKVAVVPSWRQAQKVHLVSRPPSTAVPSSAASPMNDPQAHEYTYIFEGKGTYQGRPFPNASVLVGISTPRMDAYQGTVTDADGQYSVSVKIQATPNEPVDFSVDAYTPDFQKIELTGRRIVMHEDTTVTVEKPLDFVPG